MNNGYVLSVPKYESINTTMVYYYVKRVFDILISLIGLLILLPLTLIVKLSYLLSGDTNTVFFRHKRIGKDGKYIYLWKFRTMYPNAESSLQKILAENPELKAEWDKNQKLDHDPRVTKIGRILRKTSLDEFPQFINILKGEMSLIGPRPVIDGEIEKYGKNKAKFLSMKPGLTGYWQANGRSDTNYRNRIKLELYYIDNFSFALDMEIFFKTFFVVALQKGAK